MEAEDDIIERQRTRGGEGIGIVEILDSVIGLEMEGGYKGSQPSGKQRTCLQLGGEIGCVKVDVGLVHK